MKQKIIFFELNEVPFRVIDAFVGWRPRSTLARLLPFCRQYETYSEDISGLSPWKTWPSVHRGVNDEQHMIYDLGQDLSEVDREFPPIWKLLARAGIRTGVCGSLHTYPLPDDLDGFTFFLPDTFAAGSECFPAQLSTFQEFNLQMARDSARNVAKRIPWASSLRFLAAAPGLGLRPATALDIGMQLVSERLAPWKRVRRRTYQSILAFDVFLKSLETTRPDFSTFFTNHVASAMHRYWAATFPGDYEQFEFTDDWVARYRHEIEFAMSKFDEFLARLVAFTARNPEYQLWVTTSMGQAATVALPLETQLYVSDLGRLMRALGVPEGAWRRTPAMLPRYNVIVDPEHRDSFVQALRAFEVDGAPLEWREAKSGFFSLHFGHRNPHLRNLPPRLRGQAMTNEELGLDHVKIDDLSGSCAYHIPQGVLLVYDPTDRSRKSAERPTISTLELAPTLLEHFGLPRPSYMRSPAPLQRPSR